ncbi:hypothetical protein Aperf_G00000063509 [Anoplocephala perfoliata]
MQVGTLIFSDNFDSGNLGHAELVRETIQFTGLQPDKLPVKSWANRVVTIIGADKKPLLCSKPDYHVKCWTYNDGYGTPFENGNRSWFHFSIENYTPGTIIRISIMNISRQSKMYGQGYAPVFSVSKSVADEPFWMRVSEEPIMGCIDGQNAITFAHLFTNQPNTVTHFAFSYPWSYIDSQLQLFRLEKRYLNHNKSSESPEKSIQSRISTPKIYFHRELLCYSLCGRRIDLLTISDTSRKLSELEDHFDPLLFPDGPIGRPHKFLNKKVLIITARVHPGETPGSHMFNGLLEFLLREKDERAIRLRHEYVFKLIPMLNPDGVSMGHHRTDSRGVNLNRFYLLPNFLLHPAVYAVKALATYHHLNYGKTASYPGGLSRCLFEKFIILADQYEQLAQSAEFSSYTGNLVRPPFVLPQKRKESQLAAELANALSAALNGRRPASSSGERVGKIHRCFRENTFSSLDRVPVEINGDSDCAFRSHSLHTNSEIITGHRLVNKRTQKDDFKQLSNTVISTPDSSVALEPILSIHAIGMSKRPKNADNNPLKNESYFIGRDLENAFLNQAVTKNMNCEHSNNEELNECPLTPTHLRNFQKKLEISKTDDISDEENEEDSQIRRLDRVYLNLVEQRLKGDDCRATDTKTVDAFMSYCIGTHLTERKIRSISPEESGVRCYIDLHGHCTKRGCFCYGNRLKDDRKMVDNVLYARLIAANSAFFDFRACNFSTRNMYQRDRVNNTSKEGSGRVGIWKHTGIVHCYTVEANYTSSRLLNVISPTVGDGRCATPPGSLLGPLREDLVVPRPSLVNTPGSMSTSFFANPEVLGSQLSRLVKLTDHGSYVISFTERFTLAHFHEMGRSLLIAALDMWSVNPWSRLATSACGDMIKFKPGRFCSIKALTTPSLSKFGKVEIVKSCGRIPVKLRQAEIANMKVLREWAKHFVEVTAATELPKSKLIAPSLYYSAPHGTLPQVPTISPPTPIVCRQRESSTSATTIDQVRKHFRAISSSCSTVLSSSSGGENLVGVGNRQPDLSKMDELDLKPEAETTPLGVRPYKLETLPLPFSQQPGSKRTAKAKCQFSDGRESRPPPRSCQKPVDLVPSMRGRVNSSISRTVTIGTNPQPVALLHGGKSNGMNPSFRLRRVLMHSNSNGSKPQYKKPWPRRNCISLVPTNSSAASSSLDSPNRPLVVPQVRQNHSTGKERSYPHSQAKCSRSRRGARGRRLKKRRNWQPGGDIEVVQMERETLPRLITRARTRPTDLTVSGK